MRKIPILILLLVGCASTSVTQPLSTTFARTRTDDIQDGGLITGESCQPPCFWGITPGSSNEDDTLRTINTNYVFFNCKLLDDTKQAGNRSISCMSVSLIIEDGVTSGLSFYPTVDITVAQIIKKYQEPSAVSIDIVSFTDKPPRVVMILWFDNIQTQIFLPDQDGSEYHVVANTRIYSVTYHSESSYGSIRLIGNNVSWKGYGEYSGSLPY
jgi:hypothetical protein